MVERLVSPPSAAGRCGSSIRFRPEERFGTERGFASALCAAGRCGSSIRFQPEERFGTRRGVPPRPVLFV